MLVFSMKDLNELPDIWDKEKPLVCDNSKIDASPEAGKRVRNYVKEVSQLAKNSKKS